MHIVWNVKHLIKKVKNLIKIKLLVKQIKYLDQVNINLVILYQMYLDIIILTNPKEKSNKFLHYKILKNINFDNFIIIFSNDFIFQY